MLVGAGLLGPLEWNEDCALLAVPLGLPGACWPMLLMEKVNDFPEDVDSPLRTNGQPDEAVEMVEGEGDLTGGRRVLVSSAGASWTPRSWSFILGPDENVIVSQ